MYLLAIERIPAPVCFKSLVISSSNAGLWVDEKVIYEKIDKPKCMCNAINHQ